VSTVPNPRTAAEDELHDEPVIVRAVVSDETVSAPEADSLEHRVRALQLPEPEDSRRGLMWGALLLVLGALVAAGGWYGYKRFSKSAPRAAPAATAGNDAGTTESTPNVDAPAAAPLASPGAANDVALVSSGHIIASRQMLVSPKVVGMVVYLNAEEGSQVKQGDIIAKIENVEFQADFDLASAALELAKQQLRELENGSRPEDIAQADAEVGEAEAQLSQLQADWKRKRDLRTTGIITPGELELAEAQYRAKQKHIEKLRAALALIKAGPRQERIAAAKAEVKRREAELVKAQWRLDNCIIKAPISGTILAKNAEEGNVVDIRVQKGSYSVCEMANLADIEAELMVPERDASLVHVGQRAQIRPDAYPNREYAGVVSRLMPIAERSKGAIKVRVKITVPPDEVGVYLRPDMAARVTFYKDGGS
jgi:multidrug resistance efflux pump